MVLLCAHAPDIIHDRVGQSIQHLCQHFDAQEHCPDVDHNEYILLHRSFRCTICPIFDRSDKILLIIVIQIQLLIGILHFIADPIWYCLCAYIMSINVIVVDIFEIINLFAFTIFHNKNAIS
jgi:hypothetical protein